jgi:hypothetical protein
MGTVNDYVLRRLWQDHLDTRNVSLRMTCIDRIRLEIYWKVVNNWNSKMTFFIHVQWLKCWLTLTKYDTNLNFTQFFFVLHYTELQRTKEFFLSPILPSLCLAILFFYRFGLVFNRNQFQVSMLQVLPTTTLIYSRPRQHNSKCYYRRVSILFGA